MSYEWDGAISLEITVDTLSSDTSVNDPWWRPVSPGVMGSYGLAEMHMASVAYFDVGDVGDQVWLEQRKLPFDDYSCGRMAFYSSQVCFFGNEDDFIAGEKPQLTADELFEKRDPSVNWAVEEFNSLEGKEDEASCKRREALTAFISEAKGYDEMIVQERAYNVPDWALEAIHSAVEHGTTLAPRIEEMLDGSGAVGTRMVGSSKSPSYRELQIFHNSTTEVRIPDYGERDWLFAIVDGKKVYGPYGDKVGQMIVHQPAVTPSLADIFTYRKASLYTLLSEHGIAVANPDAEDFESWHLINEIPASRDMAKALANYDSLANQIIKCSSIATSFLSYFRAQQARIRKQCLSRLTGKLRHPQEGTLKKYLKKVTGKSIFEITDEDLEEYLEEEQYAYVMFVLGEMSSMTNTYSLEVKDGVSWKRVASTKSWEIAKLWKDARPEDILWFMATEEQRGGISRPSDMMPPSGVFSQMSYEERAEALEVLDECFKNWIIESGLSASKVQALVSAFNLGHRVNTIPSIASRELSWIFTEIPFTSSQLKVARKALALIGSSIVKARMKSTNQASKIGFRKLQLAIRQAIKRGECPPQTLKQIATGTVDIDFTWETRPLPPKGQHAELIRRGFLLKEEVYSNLFVIPHVKFNCLYTKQSDVFNIVKGFRVNDGTLNLVRSMVDWTPEEEPVDYNNSNDTESDSNLFYEDEEVVYLLKTGLEFT